MECVPDAKSLSGAPGLGVASALGVRGIAIGDLRQLAEASFVQETLDREEVRFRGGGGGGITGISLDQGFAEHGKGPHPGGAIVVGGFAAGILVALVPWPIGMVGIVEQMAVMMDGEGGDDGQRGE